MRVKQVDSHSVVVDEFWKSVESDGGEEREDEGYRSVNDLVYKKRDLYKFKTGSRGDIFRGFIPYKNLHKKTK